MYTATILIEQELVRRAFPEFCDALNFIRDTLGTDVNFAQTFADVHCGSGLCTYINGCFVTLAILH